jgi:flagellar hook-length control protein FliK
LAIPLLAIGELVGQKLLSHHKGASHASALSGGLNFGAQLQQQLGQIQTDGSDPISRIAGMLQSGTPPATIIDRVSRALSGAVATLSGSDDETTRQTLQRALAGALAPPGTSPPGQSSTQLAASLEQRLQNLISRLSRVLEQNAGQQSRFSGQVLDANSARELPAQQSKQSTGASKPPADAIAFAESILQQALQALQQGGTPQSASPQSNLHLPLEQRGSPSRTLPISTHSDDLLARMLARAASADAQRQGQSAASAAPVSTMHANPSGTSGSPSQILARLLNAIAQAANEGGQSSGESGGRQQPQTFAQHAQTPAPPSNVAAFAATVAHAPAVPAQSAAAGAARYVDPNAIIEQVVKGIVLRNAGATSEVHLQLQPAHLGDVSLKLTVTGNTISANIVAQNADVRDALLSNQQHLARSLADAGLSLGKFSVNVSGGNSGFHERQLQQRSSHAKVGVLSLDTPAEDGSLAERIGPPALAGNRSLVLNYLV